MDRRNGSVAVLLSWIATAAAGQQDIPVYGNASGCDVHFERNSYEATDMVMLTQGKLTFYETACTVTKVGNHAGQINSLSAQCVGYEEVYDFTWDFQSDGQGGYVLATPDGSFSTALKVCQ